MKTCIKCGMPKELDEFYSHPEMADGHLNKCKECCKTYAKLRRIEEPDKVHESDSNRSLVSERIDYIHRNTKRWRTNNPQKYKAQNVLNNAIRDGKIIRQPCEICGRKAHAHHSDYSKPLEVRWLCAYHHKLIHTIDL